MGWFGKFSFSCSAFSRRPLLFSNFLSDLGIGPQAQWFNYGLLLTAGLLALFYNSLGVRSFAAVAGILSAFALAGVGLFPENMQPAHLVFSTSFFSLAAFSIFLFSIKRPAVKNYLSPDLVAAWAFILSGVVFLLEHSPFWETVAVALFGSWLAAYAFRT